jgi:glucose/arabinose dehydrogenase
VNGVLILFPVLAALGLYGVSYFSTPLRERERNPDRRSIRLAPGFSYSVYAQTTIDNPTVMTFGPDGKLYIGDIAGDLWVATDRDGDFRVDNISKFAGGFDLLLGLAWRSDELFVSSAGKIEALRDTNGDGVADTRRIVAEGLPALVLNPHSNNSLTFGPDGRLYFGVGRTTATGREPNPQAGAILSVSPDGGDVRVLAQGFGNPFDVAFNARGDMFVGDNAGVSADGDSPPDKFHHVVAGGDYDDENDPFGPNKKAAVVQLDPHSVPTGLTFYSGKTYPAEYFDNAFMTLWNRGEVLRIQTSAVNNGYRARESIFGDGFLYPIDVVTGPDGNLYIADFGTSVIYRITYGGK